MEINYKEVIKEAAKVCGFEIVGWQLGRRGIYWAGLSTGELWNPLYDDGDALRLAAQHRISFDCEQLCQVHAWNHTRKVTVKVADPDASVVELIRHAIVAAVIQSGEVKND